MANYKLVNADELDSKFAAIGNAIREKTGKTDLISEDDMPKEIASIPSGGEGVDYLAQRCNDTLTHYESDKVQTLQAYCFYLCKNLESVSLPEVTSLLAAGGWSNTFSGCSKLREANLPKLTSIMPGTFVNTALEQANFPAVTRINMQAFASTKLTTVHFPECVLIDTDAFYNCTSLISVNLPKLNTINTNAFRNSTVVTVNVAESNNLTMTNNAFASMADLENFTIGGKFITTANVNFSLSSKLTLASAKNIIEALPDYSGTANELKYSVIFAPKTIELLEADGETAPDGITWTDYVLVKGWNI